MSMLGFWFLFYIIDRLLFVVIPLSFFTRIATPEENVPILAGPEPRPDPGPELWLPRGVAGRPRSEPRSPPGYQPRPPRGPRRGARVRLGLRGRARSVSVRRVRPRHRPGWWAPSRCSRRLRRGDVPITRTSAPTGTRIRTRTRTRARARRQRDRASATAAAVPVYSCSSRASGTHSIGIGVRYIRSTHCIIRIYCASTHRVSAHGVGVHLRRHHAGPHRPRLAHARQGAPCQCACISACNCNCNCNRDSSRARDTGSSDGSPTEIAHRVASCIGHEARAECRPGTGSRAGRSLLDGYADGCAGAGGRGSGRFLPRRGQRHYCRPLVEKQPEIA